MYKRAGQNFNARHLTPGSARWISVNREKRLAARARSRSLAEIKRHNEAAELAAAIARENAISAKPRLVKRAVLNLPSIEQTAVAANADQTACSLARLTHQHDHDQPQVISPPAIALPRVRGSR